MLAWLLFKGIASPVDPALLRQPLAYWLSGEGTGAIVANQKGYAMRLASLLDGYKVSTIFVWRNSKPEIDLVGVDYLVLTKDWHEHDAENLSKISLKYSKDDSLYGERLYYRDSKIVNTKVGATIDYASRGNKRIDLLLEFKKESFIISSSESLYNTPKVQIKKWPEKKMSYVDREIFLEEKQLPRDTEIVANSIPWLLDELWLEYFGKNWIPFDLKERTAKFFAERYPQVVPDEAWALLGGKPAPA